MLKHDFNMKTEMYQRIKRKLDLPNGLPFDKEEALALIDEIMKGKSIPHLRLELCKYVLDVYFNGDYYPDRET